MIDTRGKCISTDKSRYVVRTKPELVAGYVGLPDTGALKKLYVSQKWKDIADAWEAKKKKNSYNVGSITQVFQLLQNRQALENYGSAGAPKEDWTAKDHCAHTIATIVKAAKSFPKQPVFGPNGSEQMIERWNRAWGLMENYHWLITKDKGKRAFFKDGYNHTASVKPAFMIPKPAVHSTQPAYHPYRFLARWYNKANTEAKFPQRLPELIRIPDLFPIADPRTTDDRRLRDHVRRTLNLKSFGLDIDLMILVTPDGSLATDSKWTEIQQLCRQGRRDADFKGFEFRVWTKSVPADQDIFESEIVVGLEEIYQASVTGTLTKSTNPADSSALDVDGGVSESQPDDFYPPEDRLINGFDVYDDAHTATRRAWQRKMIDKLSANLVEDSFEEEAGREVSAVHEQSMRLTDLTEMDDSILQQSSEDRASMSRVRGGETFLGPDYLWSCKSLKLDPKNPKPHRSRAIFKGHQVTLFRWCVTQVIGLGVRHTPPSTPSYTRAPVGGGLICDEMGLGKTHGMLSFINMGALQKDAMFAKPTLWLTTPGLLYQTVDIMLKDFPHLKVFIYHGTSIPKDDPYSQYRILPRDISGYTGPSSLQLVKKEFRFIFDENDNESRRVIIVSAYNSFRERSGIANPDNDDVAPEDTDKGPEWLNQFVKVFRQVVIDEGHALKNPETKLCKVVKALQAAWVWVITGTPMANSAADFAGLLEFLYRPAWEQVLSASDKVEWDNGTLDVFSPNATPFQQRLRAHPRHLRRAIAKGDTMKIAKYARAAMEVVYIRRTRGSLIPSGTGHIVVADNLPVLKIRTIALRYQPHEAAELQLHHRYFAQQFEDRIKANAKRTEDGKVKFNYPTDIYRRLCNLSNSLLLERVAYALEQSEITLSAENLIRWRSGDPPIDFDGGRQWLQVDLCPKLKWLCYYAKDKTIDLREKTILFFRWLPFGQQAEDFLKALGFCTALIHSGMNQLDRHKVFRAFNDPEDRSVEFLFLSYRISAIGLNAQGNCRRMILLEPGLGRNEEHQAMGRIHRELQLQPCYIYRLYMVNSMDKYREQKSTEKFIPEIAVYSDGIECAKHLQALLDRHSPEEETGIDTNEGVARAARLLTQKFFNLEGVSHEDGTNVHLVYDQLKRANIELALI